MKIAVDTSVVVAALVHDHPLHAPAFAVVGSPKSTHELIASWHAYAESWATLTAMPLEPRVSGRAASAALERLAERVRFSSIRPKSYLGAIARCAERGLRSGALYDSLHLLHAESQGADVFATFNQRDFERLTGPDGPRIEVPKSP